MKKGFTLIELSIVLVIIALIIGGILAARSMIETAALNKTISQLTQFDAGVGTFRAKYNSLPGDSKWFGGDGDRAIEGTNAFTDWDNSIGLFANEIANFWAQAMPGTYAPTPYTTGSDLSFVGPAPEPPLWATSGPNRNVPAAVIGKSNTLWHVGAVSTDLGGTQSYNPSPIQNYYSITTPYYELNGFYNIHSSDDGNLTLKPIQLFSLDKKIDDGLADTGNVQPGTYRVFGSEGRGIESINQAFTDCATGSVYEINDNSYLCVPFIRVGAISGDLK